MALEDNFDVVTITLGSTNGAREAPHVIVWFPLIGVTKSIILCLQGLLRLRATARVDQTESEDCDLSEGSRAWVLGSVAANGNHPSTCVYCQSPGTSGHA